LYEPYKEVFWMRIFGELSFREIGMLFDKTEPWARVTFHRAKMKISVKKKLLQKQILAVVAVVATLADAVIGILKNTVDVVEYKDNLSVSMVDGALVGRLQGSQLTHLKIKRVKNTLFFSVSDTK